MQASESNDNKAKGFAIVALRAYVKALEMEERIPAGATDSPYRYEINHRTGRAVVLNTRTGAVEFEDSIAEWADEGRTIRLALIGLKATKLQVEAELSARGSHNHQVLYRFDAQKGEGYILNGGKPVTGVPVEVEDWAELGAQMEKSMFAQLHAATLRRSQRETRAIKELMEKVGIIRRRAASSLPNPA
jgi:hypothetical protein